MSAPLTPERTKESPAWRAKLADDALDCLDDALNFAYEHGYHEHGVPLVTVVREHVADLRRDLSDVMGLLQRRLQPAGSPPAGTVVTLADWITQSALLRITEAVPVQKEYAVLRKAGLHAYELLTALANDHVSDTRYSETTTRLYDALFFPDTERKP